MLDFVAHAYRRQGEISASSYKARGRYGDTQEILHVENISGKSRITDALDSAYQFAVYSRSKEDTGLWRHHLDLLRCQQGHSLPGRYSCLMEQVSRYGF